MDNKPAYAELEKRVHELEQTNAAYQQLIAELRQSGDRFRLLWEQSPLGYQSLDAQGRFVEVNQSWIAILGYAREEVIGRSFADFLHPDLREHFRLNFPRFKAIGEILGVEFEMVKKNGSLITVSLYGKISRDDDGQFRQTHCIFHDITARKEAEESLRRRAEEVERLMEAVPAAVWIAHDPSCQTITGNLLANMFYEALPGENVSATKQPNVRRFFTSDGREFSAEELPMQKAVATNKDVQDAEIHVQLSSGKRINMFGNAVPLRDQDGNVRGCIGAFLDITERKRAEKTLREREAIYRNIFEDNQSVILLIDSTTADIVSSNSAACKFYGYSPEQMKQLKITDINSMPAGKVMEAIESVISARRRHLFSRHRLANGQIRDVEVFSGPITIGDQKLLYSIIHDITDRKQAEKSLRQLNQDLEQKVTERTALAEARAKQLQALAIELVETEERERRKFADLLHDDLQQMLAAAKMQVQAVASSEPMLTDAVQLLDESIAKSRRLSHQLSPAIMHQAGLISALNWLSRQVREQFGLHVELDIETELLMERTPQKVFLFRAVQELLFNSVKHAGVKSARVTVSSSEDSITVTVIDQGRGFDPQSLEKRTGNLGLGLLTIKERAGYVGGKFSIESAPGQGSCFMLTVPNAAAIGEEEAALDALIVEEPNHSRSDATISGAGGIRVLFVDDHRVMRQGLMNLVKGRPAIHVAGEASNGREAIEQAHKLLPDLILMDVSMPEMDGIEATHRIKEEFPHVRVIGLTMHDDEQISASMKQAGAEVTLSKTLSAAEVVRAIYGAIE